MNAPVVKAARGGIGSVIVVALIGLVHYHASPAITVASQGENERQVSGAWNEVLDRRKFFAPDEKSALVSSLRNTSDCSVHVFYDPAKGGVVTYTFRHNGTDVVTIDGHMGSSFATRDEVLYFAQYWSNRPGCTVLAFDLKSGKKLWKSELHHQKPLGASGYSNVVALRLSNTGETPAGKAGSAVVIAGSESYCDYVEVLDSGTGESLAIREYRVGF